ncbi:penicillin-binding transpeptidase domain-containing protein [Lacticigenium naphthae]|uniref:penicillin-binding protein PBP4(5) n=1 Tax=Lacticigenium naphthae TaxID=515351 RepID=UPI00041E8AC9|nr:penicillin-binding transpeptidase domain-containing protein [Lacticigenium naphthae]
MVKKNRNKKQTNVFVKVAGVILLLLLIVFLFFQWSESRKEQEQKERIAHFVSVLEERKYDELGQFFSEDSLQGNETTPEAVSERISTIYDGIGVSEIRIDEDIELTGENLPLTFQYKATFETALGEIEGVTFESQLIEQEEGYFINWNPNLLFPEMKTGDTVRLNKEKGKRGELLDRNGNLLAGEGNAYQAGLYPGQLGTGDEKGEALATISEELLVDREELERLLEQSWVTDDSFVPVTIVEEGNTPELNGIIYQETTTRVYPLQEAGAHLIGYIGNVTAEDIEKNPSLTETDQIGKSGLEFQLNDRLSSQEGGSIVILDEEGEVKNTLISREVENGETIALTIDAEKQRLAYQQLEGERGAAVVSHPQTGELMVLTSSPAYDPTKMMRGLTQDEYTEYLEDEGQPFLNRFTSLYAPASTFKMVTAAIGLDSQTIDPKEALTIEGSQWTKDETWGDYAVARVNATPTQVNLEDALIYSDNIYFAKQAIEMGAETLSEGLQRYPFKETVDLPLSMEAAQLSNSGSLDTELLLVNTAYGQGELLMSPIHQAVFYSSIGNKGKLVYPKLLQGSEESESKQVVSSEAAEWVKEALKKVITSDNGTAKTLDGLNRNFAAKTGTGEYFDAEMDENAINGFVTVFDAEEADFMFVGFVEGYSGGEVAELFKDSLVELDNKN